jgi:hypothetical protein
MKILQNEITGTQTRIFSSIFGGKLSFILSLLFGERLHRLLHIFSVLLLVPLLLTNEFNVYDFFRIKSWMKPMFFFFLIVNFTTW